MTRFTALVLLSLRDLARRRLLWLIAVMLLGGLLLVYWTQRYTNDLLSQGASYDIATRKAAQKLEGFADAARNAATFAVVLVAAIVAPESRRNGTTQFVLASGVGRLSHAASQFVALAAFVTAGTLVLHGGYCAAAASVANVTSSEILLGWALLLVPLLAVAAAVFSMSLTLSTIEVLLVFLAAPFGLYAAAQGGHSFLPLVLVRLLESAVLLFPNPTDVTPWPHLALTGLAHGPPAPQLFWPAAHALLATVFWTVWGLLLLRRHDFGSRAAIK